MNGIYPVIYIFCSSALAHYGLWVAIMRDLQALTCTSSFPLFDFAELNIEAIIRMFPYLYRPNANLNSD